MKFFLCLLFVLISSAGNAEVLNNPRSLEDLEYLFTHMNKREISLVTHQYRRQFRTHSYYLGCIAEVQGQRRVGLLTYDWQRCYTRGVRAKLKANKDFFHMIEDDAELKLEAGRFLHSLSGDPDYPSRKEEEGYWEKTRDFYVKYAPCLAYVSAKTNKEFCLHSKAAAQEDLSQSRVNDLGVGFLFAVTWGVPTALAFLQMCGVVKTYHSSQPVKLGENI